MIQVIAPLARVVIMALATAGPVTALQEVLDGTFAKLIDSIRDEHGLTTEEATDIFMNILVDLSLNAAVIGTVIKTKLGVKAAERLGLTTKGFSRRTLTTKAAAAMKKMDGPWEKFKAMGLVSKILTLGGIATAGTWLFSSFANIVEPFIYQRKAANDVWERITGVRPFPDLPSQLAPGNYSPEAFSSLASSLEAAGIKGISNPVALRSEPYSRHGLAELIDYVYGQKVLAGEKVQDHRSITPLLNPYLVGATASSTGGAAQPAATGSTTISPSVKVFTGVISQGVLGTGLSFTERQDDLIESMSELQEAINNNVGPYVAALPGKITYEVKVVPSVIVKGIRLYGETKQIKDGTYKDGTPKMKTVTNKFAVVNLYFVKEDGARAKLVTINLGPTNATKFQPTPQTLQSVEQGISANLLTSDTNDIAVVVSDTPTASTTPTTPVGKTEKELKEELARLEKERDALVQSQKPQETTQGKNAPDGRYIFTIGNTTGTVYANSYAEALKIASRHGKVDTINGESVTSSSSPQTTEVSRVAIKSEDDEALKEKIERVNGVLYGWLQYGNKVTPRIQIGAEDDMERHLDIYSEGGVLYAELTKTPKPEKITIPYAPQVSPAQKAKTLSEYYAAQGRSLPSISERGKTYQQLGLGQASYYVGSAEQNTKLLNALKGGNA